MRAGLPTREDRSGGRGDGGHDAALDERGGPKLLKAAPYRHDQQHDGDGHDARDDDPHRPVLADERLASRSSKRTARRFPKVGLLLSKGAFEGCGQAPALMP